MNHTTARNPYALATEIIASWQARDHNSLDRWYALRGSSVASAAEISAAQRTATRSLHSRWAIRRAAARRAEVAARRWRDTAARHLPPHNHDYDHYAWRWALARAELARVEDAADHLMELTGLSFTDH